LNPLSCFCLQLIFVSCCSIIAIQCGKSDGYKKSRIGNTKSDTEEQWNRTSSSIDNTFSYLKILPKKSFHTQTAGIKITLFVSFFFLFFWLFCEKQSYLLIIILLINGRR
jgi:hypothetical protein